MMGKGSAACIFTGFSGEPHGERCLQLHVWGFSVDKVCKGGRGLRAGDEGKMKGTGFSGKPLWEK